MLTETQKVAVDKLVGNGANVSQTAKRLGLTREYVQTYVASQNSYVLQEDDPMAQKFISD